MQGENQHRKVSICLRADLDRFHQFKWKQNKQTKKKNRFSDMINQDIPYYTGCSRMEEFTSYLKYVDKIII